MGVDGDLTSIIREFVQFLESLYGLNLPSKIENARINLLQRSRTKLSTLTSRRSTSPEPYLDMNAGKGFPLFPRRRSNRDTDIEEYVGVEEPIEHSSSVITANQDYYETFQEMNLSNGDISGNVENRRCKTSQKHQNREDEAENKLREIYKTFTPAKTRNKAHKSGLLYQKVERKPFGFVRGNMRQCWIGLVGSHLLIYGSEYDKQPPEISCIRDYSARAAPNSVSRDPERAKSAFEIFCPGNKTLQFMARSPKVMEEWLDAINRTCTRTRESANVIDNTQNMEDLVTSNEEKYQDIGILMTPSKLRDPTVSLSSVETHLDVARIESARNSIILGSTTPPLLPVRSSPRRLPSLPNDEIPAASYEPLDDADEEDDIYHKIEDFRDNPRSYENLDNSSKKSAKNRKRKRKSLTLQTETYDDVENADTTIALQDLGETYDDVRSTLQCPRITNIPDSDTTAAGKSRRDSPETINGIKNQSFESYDDVFQSPSPSKLGNPPVKTTRDKDSKVTKRVETANVHTESAKDNAKNEKNSTRCDKTITKGEKNSGKLEKSNGKMEKNATKLEKGSSKSSHKRSFLDRVRHRKDSPKKEEKKRAKESSDSATKSERKVRSSSDQLTDCVEPTCVTRMPDLPTYDDISDLVIESVRTEETTRRASSGFDETSNYNCPPPPRPIYLKPPSPVLVLPTTEIKDEDSLVNEIYDDIGRYNGSLETDAIPTDKGNGRMEMIKNLPRDESTETENEGVTRAENNSRAICQEKRISADSEHYQTPRMDSLALNVPVTQTDEELYDDIAVAEYRASGQCSQEISSTSGDASQLNTSTSSNEAEGATRVAKKSWNRFGSVKKTLPQTTFTRSKYSVNPDDLSANGVSPASGKQAEAMKLNKFQKLINKMESTLGNKPSAKSFAPVLNKTQSE